MNCGAAHIGRRVVASLDPTYALTRFRGTVGAGKGMSWRGECDADDERRSRPPARARRGAGHQGHVRRAVLRPRLRVRRHAALPLPARASHAHGRRADGAAADGGVVGVDLHLLGDQLARPGEDRRPADAVRADAGGPGPLDLHPAGLRVEGPRVRRRLRVHAGRALPVHAVGAAPRQAPATSATSSASPPGWRSPPCSGSPALLSRRRRGSRCGLLALLIEYVSPSVGFWTPGLGRSTTADWDIAGSHMAERCGLFIIIALGESILVTGAKFGNLPWTLPVVAAFTIAFVGSVAMWWIYFNIGAETGEPAYLRVRRPGQARATGLHLPASAAGGGHHRRCRRR